MNEHTIPDHREEYVSKVPALHLLRNLGYAYLTPEEARVARGGRTTNVVLTGVLKDWLKEHNTISYAGEETSFSDANIAEAVQALTDVGNDGLVMTNQKTYELLTLGKSLAQPVRGDTKSFTLRYVDWERPENNVYHVTEEFPVAPAGGGEEKKPDIVLFVNGIPSGVIECKRTDTAAGKDPLDQGIEQMIRNQKDDGIPRLFAYAQLLMASNKNQAKYATVGTAKDFWSTWREPDMDESTLRALVNTPWPKEDLGRLFARRRAEDRARHEERLADGCETTEQDRALYALCRPERLLGLARRFIVFDAGAKKIARYQQYFCVRKIMERITSGRNQDGSRPGGFVWHTQGSGKSLTMVMLARAIALSPAIRDYKIVVVTDRHDLDEQIHGTFRSCGEEPERAASGRHLARLLSGKKAFVVTTVVNKFDKAVSTLPAPISDPNVIVLVDESHRTQYGALHAKMRQALPLACYVGFTGTPIMKRDKNILARFGGLIDHYDMRQAVEDKAVVPLLYEGRHVSQYVTGPIDRGFDRVSEGLSDEQSADLKRKFSTTDQLNKAEQKVDAIAYDISVHFRDNWQGTGFKAQLAAPDKATALLYKERLDEIGMVTSEVLISPPDEREGAEDIYAPNTDKVNVFWKAMMSRYGSETEYNRQVKHAFMGGGDPEIIIVVDKLLTGFDAPRNTVLYIARRLKEHTLLQAIARVNRLHEGKQFGYIVDYRDVLKDLNDALNIYAALPEFDRMDLESFAKMLTDISDEVKELGPRHTALWDVFKEISNKRDQEAFELLLGHEDVRARFYERLRLFGRTLAVALSSAAFLRDTEPVKVDRYKEDLKFFEGLRRSVERRYAERVDFKALEPRIQKLIDTHVSTGDLEEVTPLVNIFDEKAFEAEVAKIKDSDAAAKADTIAHRALKSIQEEWKSDPVFYKRFSDMLTETIEAFRKERLESAGYLLRVQEITSALVRPSADDLPEAVRGRDVARAYFGTLNEAIGSRCDGPCDGSEIAAQAALAVDDIIQRRRIVSWATNTDVQNGMLQEIEDYLFDMKDEHGLALTIEQMEQIMEQCLDIAKARVP